MHFAENLGLQQLRRTTATEYYWEQQKDEYSANARTHARTKSTKQTTKFECFKHDGTSNTLVQVLDGNLFEFTVTTVYVK